MMRTKLFAAILITGLTLPLIAQQAKADTLTIKLTDQTNQKESDYADYPPVNIVLSDEGVPAGTVKVTVKVIPGKTGYIGDLRGVYFNLPAIGGLNIQHVSGGPINNKTTTGNFKDFSNSADLKGVDASFNAGVEIGRQGIPDGDDYQETVFKISGTGLKLSNFTSGTFGVRMQSVGLPGTKREASSKTAGVAPPDVIASNPTPPGGGTTPPGGETTPPGGETTPPGGETTPPGGETTPPGGETPSPKPSESPKDPTEVPEPTTIVGSMLALGAFAKWRKGRGNQKN